MSKSNSVLIQEAVQEAFTPDQIHTLAAAHFSADAITARAACIKVTDDDGNELDSTPFAELDMIADQFHTFQGWKKLGLSVKKGEKASLVCWLWKWTDKPNAAARKAAEEAGEELNPDPHYYKALSYLFFVDQVERRNESAPAKKPASSMAAYNRYLSAQRKAGNKSPLSLSAWTAQQAAEPVKPQQSATKSAKKSPAKKASTKPAAPAPAVVAVVEHHDLHETATPAAAPEELDFAALAASIIF